MDQKIWGETEKVFATSTITVHILRVKKGGVCSWHYHDRKYNHFYVISGELLLRTVLEGMYYPTKLRSGETHTICPGVENRHEFEALEDSVVIETCFVDDVLVRQIDPDDIHRLRLGYYKCPCGWVSGDPLGGTVEKEKRR